MDSVNHMINYGKKNIKKIFVREKTSILCDFF
jgi:hypothetical protein